ncbi:subclass B1 metallo-beta-lactamase [Salmonirosea aquatica]|uniref:beta-lactamase n=1 Tax=Salmonirosea aquatica TaxID=2654236 RepID=A0A7C9BKB7_9BACT|nr:subclass B1 metallo-beta-lactamase [Cytophagaceae bacterium SJW1-29]
MIKYTILLVAFVSQSLLANKTYASQPTGTFISATQITNAPEYESENLIINKLSDHVYQHISYLNTETFGRVACNGMIVINGNEAIVFDTPATNETSEELIGYLTEKLHAKINGVVATHFHADCVGGLEAFHQKNIPSYAENRTIAFLKDKGTPQPQKGFDNSLTLKVGNKKVYAQFMGEGHTRDNVIGYFPEDEAMFGGCLIKEVGAGKGNLEDANVAAWPATVRNVKARYPQAKIVIPGHGKVGGTELLDFTVKLFE